MLSRRLPIVLSFILFTLLVSTTSFVAGAALRADVAAVLSSRVPLVAGSAAAEASSEARMTLFRKVWDIVDREYFGRPIDYDKMMQGALRGMVESLGDPHTQYITPEHNNLLRDDERGSFQGIGATLDQVDDQFVVVVPLPGSPADKAGLQAGDVLLAVDGQDLAGLTLTDVVLKVRGQVGTTVTLTVRRGDGGAPFDITVERGEIPVRTVEHRLLDDGTGYIALSGFGGKTVEELDAALADLKASGAERLILDVRDNPGGFLEAAVQVVSRFVASGAALHWQNADGSTREVRIQPRPDVVKWPMVVLVNAGSASAAEIVAGALQDYGRARLAGEQTFGKGSVQNVHQLDDGGSVRVTTAHWLTPTKRGIDGVGLAPDVTVERTKADMESKRDPQLAWAETYLSGHASRARWLSER